MKFSSIKVAMSGLMLAGGLAVSGSASALAIKTSALDANSNLQFSAGALKNFTDSGIQIGALGNAKPAGAAGAYILPITKIDVSLGWNLRVKPISGESLGSALSVRKGNDLFALANFAVDYRSKSVTADVFGFGVQPRLSVFSFEEKTPLTIKLRGLGLSMNQTLGNLKLTDAASASFADMLDLSTGLTAILKGLDFGTITINATTAPRGSQLPLKGAFTAAMLVPEPSTYAMMALGLFGIGVVARRKVR